MPLELVRRVLERRGALVERLEGEAAASGSERAQALLPPELAAELGLAEELELAALARPGAVACGYGSELLRGCAAWATSGRARAVARVGLPAPRPGQPAGYDGLNVALRPGSPTPGEAWTVTTFFRADAVADDRRQFELRATVDLAGGAALPGFTWEGSALEPCASRPPAQALRLAAPALWRSARAEALAGLEELRRAVARRWRRDVLRVDGYFADLDRDLAERLRRAPGSRGLADKRAALPRERARRLATLRENALLRVELSPIASLSLSCPVALAPLEVLRRNARRTLEVRYHPLQRDWLPLACEGCGAAVRVFGACDEAVHLLCRACLDEHGPRRCPRCLRGGPPPLEERWELPAETTTVLVAALPPDSPLAAHPAPDPAAQAPAPAPSALAQAASGPGSPAPHTEAGSDARETAPPRAGRRAAPAEPRARRRAAPAEPRAAAPGQASPSLSELLAAAPEGLRSEELQRATGLSAPALRAALSLLIEAGRVERSGRARATRYRWLAP